MRSAGTSQEFSESHDGFMVVTCDIRPNIAWGMLFVGVLFIYTQSFNPFDNTYVRDEVLNRFSQPAFKSPFQSLSFRA